jgi:hypothetical protein
VLAAVTNGMPNNSGTPHIQGDLMATTTEVDELHRLIAELRRCVTSLASSHGDTLAMRRVVNDTERILNGIDRLGIDADELGLTCGLAQSRRSSEMIQIPDADYDAGFWRDVDHEGVGGQSLAGADIRRTRR